MDAKPRQFTFKVTVTVTDQDTDARKIAEEIQSNLESVGAESVSVEIEEGGTLSERLDQ